jgi:hypothetical protein
MPIRINLLAEAQAAEDLRRRDPTKRALRIAVVLVVAVLVWSGSLQVHLVSENVRLSRLQDSISNKATGYTTVINHEQELAVANSKLSALRNLAAGRFLQADLLNALQRTIVDGIQITKLHLDQSYADPADDKQKAAGNVEKVLLTLEAKDSSANPGDAAINRFKEEIAANPYFKNHNLTADDILLRNLSTPQVDADTGRPFVTFVLECRYPDKFHSL